MILKAEMSSNPGETRTCPDCGGQYETFHAPPATKCADCRIVWHLCATCGDPFGLDPLETSIESFGPDCLMAECASYDVGRDPTFYFEPDDPGLVEGGV